MKKIILNILILIGFSHFVHGQTNLKIALKTVEENPVENTLSAIYDQSNFDYDSAIVYKGIPKDLSSYIIKILDFQPPQGQYELYLRLNGKMPVEALAQGFSFYTFQLKDTAKLSRTPIKHFVSFLIGKNDNGQTIIIGDANNNYDFSDDKEFKFDSSGIVGHDVPESKRWIAVNQFHYQYSYNGHVTNYSIFLGMSPVNLGAVFHYRNPIEQKLFLIISLFENKVGVIKTKDTVRVVLSGFSNIYNAATSKIYFNNDGTRYNLVGDTISLGNNSYLIKHINPNGDSLFLTYLGIKNTDFGRYVGESAYSISSTDFITKAPFNLSSLRGKYVLLDFWGSWCKPCIASIPDLVKFHAKFKNKLEIVSIAEDSIDDFDLLKTIVKNKKMNWTHLFETLSNTSEKTIANNYRIEFFPTQILIDPKGKILYRSTRNSPDIEETQLSALINK